MAEVVSAHSLEEAAALDRLAKQLNEHGFALAHTSDELFKKVRTVMRWLEQPLVAASLPWLLRRALGRPLRKRW